MAITKFFGHTFIVNLPERTDRAKETRACLKRNGVPDSEYEFFPAIRPDDAAGFPSIGARGCFLSHLSILKLARDRKLESVLVLEDDIELSHLDETVEAFRELETLEWGFVYPGHVLPPDKESPPSFIPHPGSVRATHCYAVHSRIYDPLIDYLENILKRPPGHIDGGPMHVDGAYSRFHKDFTSIPMRILTLPVGYQRFSQSDISTSRYDKHPLFSVLVPLARRARNAFRRLSGK